MANVTEMPPVEAPDKAELAAANELEQESSAPKPDPRFKHKGGRGLKKPPELHPAFFKQVASIPAEDWGTRAFMYLYITEPVCVPKTWGANAYAVKSSEPILDLEPIKQQFGSCKGWLSLNVRKNGKDATDQMDRFDFEILDPTCPPRIARGAWANDPKNDKWKALLPSEPPPPSAGAASLMDGIRVYKDIVSDVKQELGGSEPQGNRMRETLETVKLAKDLFAPPAVAPVEAPKPADPFDTAKKIMDMRTNDPMITLLLARMDAQDKQMEAARQREHDLQKELRQAQSAPVASKGLLEQITELAAVADKLEPLKKLFGWVGNSAANGAGEGVRAAKMTTLEFLSDVIPKVFESPLANAAAQRLMMPSNGTQPNPAIPQPPGAAPTDTQFQQFIAQIVTPKMLGWFSANPNADGGEAFADWVYAGFPEFFARLQKFSHPLMPGIQGAPAIVAAYKQSNIWPRLAAQELQFVEFVEAFCKWDPKAEDDDEIPNAEVIENDGIIDLDATPTEGAAN